MLLQRLADYAGFGYAGFDYGFVAELVLGLLVLSQIVKVVYRLYFHPLRTFPGPRLAAVSDLFVTYHQAWRGGKLVFELPRLHAEYGPIIRLSPNELHFSDPSVYNVIYGQANPQFVKDRRFYRTWGMGESLAALCEPEQAKVRREILAGLFSKKAVAGLQGLVVEKVKLLIRRLVEESAKGGAGMDGGEGGEGGGVDAFAAFKCLTADIISYYCFGYSMDCLLHPTFHPSYIRSLKMFMRQWWKAAYFWRTSALLRNLPESVVLSMSPDFIGDLHLKKLVQRLVRQHISRPELAKAEAGHATIFEKLLTPNAEKGYATILPERIMVEEGWLLMAAGTEEGGNALGFALYHLLVDPEKRRKLVQELDAAESFDLARLERLPYLNGVVKESTRFAGIPGRLVRVVPKGGAVLSGVHIPEGTSVCQCNFMLHFNPDIYASPWEFIPERWAEEHERDLELYHVPFTKGPRQCPGINLANAELTITLAHLFRELELELVDTTEKDMEWRDSLTTDIDGVVKVRVVGRRDVDVKS